MLDKLKDISSILIIPTAVLYCLGFVCVTSFLAQFGMISFDIINARYLIAGVYPLLGLIIACVIALHTDSKMPATGRENNIRGFSSYKARYSLYFTFLISNFLGSIALRFLMNLVEYESSGRAALYHFGALGRFDYVGRLIEAAPWKLSENIDFLIRASAEVTAYSLLIILICWIGYKCWMGAGKRGKETPPPVAETTQTGPRRDTIRWQKALVLVGDVVFLSFLLVLVFWSLGVLKYYRFDFQSLTEKPDLPHELVFAWLYSATFGILVFLSWTPVRTEQLSLDFSRILSHPANLPGVLQQAIAPLLLALFAFGATIFPRTPFALGGGAPREVVLISKIPGDPFAAKVTYLIGESNQFVFVVQFRENSEPRSLQISKDGILFIEIKRHANGQHPT